MKKEDNRKFTSLKTGRRTQKRRRQRKRQTERERTEREKEAKGEGKGQGEGKGEGNGEGNGKGRGGWAEGRKSKGAREVEGNCEHEHVSTSRTRSGQDSYMRAKLRERSRRSKP